MKTADIALIDTNILVYAADATSPFHSKARHLREQGLSGEINLCISLQVLSEYYAVITDPKRVNQPLPPAKALEDVTKYYDSQSILKIFPTSASFEIMIDLLSRYKVTRQQIFDLQRVVTMLSNNITRLYT